MNNKIGILTMYYGSNNFGGALQAYALCKTLELMGKDVEQICYDRKYDLNIKGRTVKWTTQKLNNFELLLKKHVNLKNERSAVSKWSLANTTHSSGVYTKKNIADTNQVYAYFIAGSDQIWTDAYSDTYLLGFVSEDKRKISYAASIGNTTLTEEMEIRFKKYLSTFSYISVREKSAIALLKPCTDKTVTWCLDPTLLLTVEEWNKVCSPRLCQEKYMFCYFLGENQEARELAKEYARRKGMKIINFPYLQNKYRKMDASLGDKNICNANPGDFISYIRYADAVFTDSFHASVFSIIYNKKFVAFQRNCNDKTTGRLYSLTKIFGCEDHFCDSDEKLSLEYIEKICVDKEYSRDLLESMRNESLSFLAVATK